MRVYNFILYCLHSLLPRQKYIRDYRYAAGYLLTFLTVTLVCTVYGLFILQSPYNYSKAGFRFIFITTFISSGYFNYRISKSKELFKAMIDENKPTTMKHKIVGLGLIALSLIAFVVVVYFLVKRKGESV